MFLGDSSFIMLSYMQTRYVRVLQLGIQTHPRFNPLIKNLNAVSEPPPNRLQPCCYMSTLLSALLQQLEQATTQSCLSQWLLLSCFWNPLTLDWTSGPRRDWNGRADLSRSRLSSSAGRWRERQSPLCPEGSTCTQTLPQPVCTGAASSFLSRSWSSPTTTWIPLVM